MKKKKLKKLVRNLRRQVLALQAMASPAPMKPPMGRVGVVPSKRWIIEPMDVSMMDFGVRS